MKNIAMGGSRSDLGSSMENTAMGGSRSDLGSSMENNVEQWVSPPSWFRHLHRVDNSHDFNPLLWDSQGAIQTFTAKNNFEPKNGSNGLTQLNKRYQKASITSEDTTSSAYLSANSVLSRNTYSTAESRCLDTKEPEECNPKESKIDDDYARLLQSKNLWPIDEILQLDWSGRGQHTTFQNDERKLLNEVLEVQETLGSTRTAVVESVKCKRILLARKTMRCNQEFSKMQAIEEVAHLTRLNHSHIVRVIGTYTMGKTLSILMYPAAEYNLRSFLDSIDSLELGLDEWNCRLMCLERFPACLLCAVNYIHSQMTKHMDIKPENILVRKSNPENYKVYITDFGIARAYDSLEATETEGPTTFTRKYAAPEVVDRQKRGLGADIFSLGCVFVEILARNIGPHTLSHHFGQPVSIVEQPLLYDESCEASKNKTSFKYQLQSALESNPLGDTSYQANIAAIQYFVSCLPDGIFVRDTVYQMLSTDPCARGPQPYMGLYFPPRLCCSLGTDALEVWSENRST